MAVALSLALLGVSAASAQAAPRDSVSFTCTSVTYTFSGFPEGPNTVKETVKLEKSVIAVVNFTFKGPSGTNTVPISVPFGSYHIQADALWKTWEVDLQLRGGIFCPAVEPAFKMEKLQRLQGGSEPFTTQPLQAEAGQTVDYEIIVSNTGNTSLKFSQFLDAHCDAGTIAGGPGAKAVPWSQSTTYTCRHLLTAADKTAGSYENTASVTGTPPPGEGGPISHTSNTVVVRFSPAPQPGFTIEKLQRTSSFGEFTTLALTGEVGQTVEYEVIVTDTGNTPLTFGVLTDEHCDGGTLAGGPTGTLKPGDSATYTCSHVLAVAGPYENTASVTATPPPGEGSPVSHTSNTVVVNVPPKPAFAIEDLQKVEGKNHANAYTSGPVTGEVGQTAYYEAVVKNTGNTSLGFENFIDTNCGSIKGGPGGPLGPGQSAVYTCSHVLTTGDKTAGSYENNSTVTANPPAGQGAPITQTSNTLVITFPPPPPPVFTIEKLQRVAGVGTFTSATLSGEVGQTVEYEVIVTVTGTAPLKFSNFKDQHCDEGTIAGGPAEEAQLKPGESTTYTCSHVLTAADRTAGSYENHASVTGTPPEGEGAPEGHTSNKVVVTVT